jgi:Rrf2 family protein
MQINKEIDYGLRAMIIIASDNKLLPAKEISKRFNIPLNYLSLILAKLTKIGLVKSIQGPKGGYELAKPANEINFLEIINALNGPINLISCNEGEKCELDSLCSMVGVWSKLKLNMEEYFRGILLSDVLMDEGKIMQICNARSAS